MKIYLTHVFKIKSARILFLFSLMVAFNCGQALADKKFDHYKDEREAALLLIKGGNTKLGLITLVKLSDRGDGVSSHSLGLLYLKAHHIIKPNIEKALRLFEIGALQCFEPSLGVLKQNFWGKKNSKYYDSKKISYAQNKCEQEALKGEAAKKAKEQKLEEAESDRLRVVREEADKKVEEQKIAEAESNRLKAVRENKIFNETANLTADDSNNLITSKVIMAWSNILPKFSNPVGQGSGFAITQNGYFITNHHVVVREKCKNIAVNYNELNGTGKIITFSEDLDLALLKVDAPTPYFSAFDTTALKAGEPLVALGYPIGEIFGEEPTISEGALTNISDKETKFRSDGFLIISVPITQGNSGGPILSNNLGIRGISSYGIRTEDAEDYFKENYGSSLNLSSINLNFMISGIRAYDWLEKSADFLNLVPVNKALDKANTQTIAKTGLKVLAKIQCYEG